MRSTFPTREELLAMPLSRIRRVATDIQDKDEEELVQEVVNIKRIDEPAEGIIYRNDVPDIRTKEEEEKWQKIIDERTRKAKGITAAAFVEPAKTEQVPDNALPDVQPTRFCEFCDSKGGRHKKNCPTLKKE